MRVEVKKEVDSEYTLLVEFDIKLVEVYKSLEENSEDFKNSPCPYADLLTSAKAALQMAIFEDFEKEGKVITEKSKWAVSEERERIFAISFLNILGIFAWCKDTELSKGPIRIFEELPLPLMKITITKWLEQDCKWVKWLDKLLDKVAEAKSFQEILKIYVTMKAIQIENNWAHIIIQLTKEEEEYVIFWT